MIEFLLNQETDSILREIAFKAIQNERINEDEGKYLYKKSSIALLGVIANYLRDSKQGDNIYFNKNIHIEPTNICIYDCKFCSYSRKLREKEKYDAWELSESEILATIKKHYKYGITEVHIVGGVHPKMGLDYFCNLITNIKKEYPDLHIKAFTAVELKYMCQKAKVSYKEGLLKLKEAGQNSLPGGGAEIFHPDIRTKICKDKCTGKEWLEIHKTAHELGMKSNATMLYGHYESVEHIINHLSLLRNLQDQTNGFNAFIPLKFRNANNQMSDLNEVSIIEDLRMYAFSRIFLDNFNHLKAYWPMIGKETTKLLLSFGVDDIDGTVHDTTKIYTMAGAEEQNPAMTVKEIKQMAESVSKKAVERDSVYNILKVF